MQPIQLPSASPAAGHARTKLDLLYHEVQGEVASLVERLETTAQTLDAAQEQLETVADTQQILPQQLARHLASTLEATAKPIHQQTQQTLQAMLNATGSRLDHHSEELTGATRTVHQSARRLALIALVVGGAAGVLGGSRTDPQTARDMSESLGKHEVERPKYSVSRSVDHRNTSDNMDRTVEDVVTAAQIQALPVLEGYVALAGDLPVARVRMPYQSFDKKAAAIQDAE